MERLRKTEGFTLIELLVVVAIIAILAAIAIPQYAKYRERAAKAKAISDAKNIATALESYYADYQSYPASWTSVTDTAPLSKNDTIIGYAVDNNTAYHFTVSNTLYGKYVTYNSATGGVDENTWQ